MATATQRTWKNAHAFRPVYRVALQILAQIVAFVCRVHFGSFLPGSHSETIWLYIDNPTLPRRCLGFRLGRLLF